MGGGRIFPKILCVFLLDDDLSNEPNFGWIHFAGQYLTWHEKLDFLVFLFYKTISKVAERMAGILYLHEETLFRIAKYLGKRTIIGVSLTLSIFLML
jgi:hypothetical protein